MKKLLLVTYNLVICATLAIISTINAHTLLEAASGLLYLPLVFFFFKELIRHVYSLSIAVSKTEKPPLPPYLLQREKPASSPTKKAPSTPNEITPNPIPEYGKILDADRRIFLKLIGSAGISLFMLALFTKRAQAAFFGSVPGPGTIALKDTAGNKIDPAEKHPTDGYRVNQVDDSSPAYYGFVNKDGAWYIQKEDSSGNYRYTKGATSFSTNWTNRASLTYDYFDNIF